MTLAEVLAPVPVEEFLRSYLGQRYVVIRGRPGRFHHMLSWQALNDALSRLRVNDNRVSLVRQAQGIARESYVQSSQSGAVQYLIGPAVLKHVSAGATLVVKSVDELFPEIRRLAESCEETFQIYVSANLYAGWRTDNGFDVHWDQHDTLIVQVRGRKEWKVWRPTLPHPLGGDGRGLVPRPSEDPVWQGTLGDGDTLYMPRGWWHVAYPRDEASLHVTLGVNHPTGMDLLTWIQERVREVAEARMAVPHWKSASEQVAWIRALREAYAAALSDDAIEAFMSGQADRAHVRPTVYLSETLAADSTATSVGGQAPLRLMRGRRLHLQRRGGASVLHFVAQGREWQCPGALAPALALLNNVKPCTMTEMARVLDDRATPFLRPFVLALVMEDVIWVEPVHEPSEASPAASVAR